MRLACVALAVLVSSSIGLFIDVLASTGAPAQQAFAAGPVVVAKAQPSG
jgi:hypothetical protein